MAPVFTLLAVFVLAFHLSGCSSEQSEAAYDRVETHLRAALSKIGLAPGTTSTEGSPAAQGRRAKEKRKGGPHLVEVAKVTVESLRLSSVYTGSLRSRRTVRIFNQEPGRLVSLPFFEGDQVSAGEPLLVLDDALLSAEHDKAVAVRKEAQSNLARLQRLRAKRMVPEDEFVRAETAVAVATAEQAVLSARLGYARVAAPFSGVVARRLVEPGDILAKFTHVLTLIDPASIVIDLDVSEMLLAHIAVGSTASVRIDALGDAHYDGKVARIHPSLNPRTRQGRVEVALNPVPPGARPGQFARATFSVDAPARKTVPFAALRRDVEGEYVLRVDPQQRAQRVPVRSGRRVGDRVEVVEGLAATDVVITRGFLGLESGKTVESLDTADTATANRQGS